MNYTLFIQHDCDACDEVVQFIDANDISCAIKDIAREAPPITRKFGIILPALFADGDLVAYGPEDILQVLRLQSSTKNPDH